MGRKSAFAILRLENNLVEIYLRVKHNRFTKKVNLKEGFTFKDIERLFLDFLSENSVKVIAVGLFLEKFDQIFAQRLWLKYDIVPYYFKLREFESHGRDYEKFVNKIKLDFDKNYANVSFFDINSRVKVHDFLVGLDEVSRSVPSNHFELLKDYANEFQKKKLKMAFFNSSTYGGGVALMRHALIRLCKLLDLDVSWYVVNGDVKIFQITKQKIHNVLHGINKEGYELTNIDKTYYNKWTEQNAKKFEKVFRKLDVAVIDDPQPSGLISWIKKINPSCKIIYRSHTQLYTHLIDKENTVQNQTWKFLGKNILKADLFVSHPIKSFVPGNVPKGKVVFMPPTTDLRDGLNKRLSKEDQLYYEELFDEILSKSGQDKLNFEKEYFVQIARFDPAKGIFDLLEAYRLFYEKSLKENLRKIPNLVIVGNGANDDPEGNVIFNKVLLTLRSEKYYHILENVKVIMVPFRDQLLNVLLSQSYCALQLSHREGYEIKVTEALMKGKPVIIYNSGGMPLQVENEVNGFIVKGYNIKEVADRMYEIWVNKELYVQMSKNAIETYDKNISTVKNLINWLFLALNLVNNKEFKGEFKDINDLLEENLRTKNARAGI